MQGILNPPVYVTSAYIYQRELDKLQSWIGRALSVKDQGTPAIFDAVHGNLEISVRYVGTDGFPFGKWLCRHRDGSIRVTLERWAKLDTLGMVWEKPGSLQTQYKLAKGLLRGPWGSRDIG